MYPMQTDYIIIGAGTAGCLLASRLSEDGANVLLLEAGPRAWHPMIHIPAGVRSLHRNPRVNWNFMTEPDPGIDGRSMHWPRGKVIGGSGSINGMLYVRGNPGDYDGWAQSGCTGWGYADVLPYFKMSESYARGDDRYRGKSGPMIVEDYRTVLPLTHRFVEAACASGIPMTTDYNGAQQEGVGYSQMTRLGRFRGSTASTFLAQARGRANLRVETRAQVTKLLIESGRCAGVLYRQNGVDRTLRAEREVILSAGSIKSPQLLQLSGIGSAAHLKSLGIEVVHDLPGVGANLSDHYVGFTAFRVKEETSINELARGWRLGREVLRWIFSADGALTFGVTSSTIFTRSRESLSRPDLQLLFTPASYDQSRFGELEKVPGVTVAVCAVQPQSRGTVMARSNDPFAPPVIRPNYLSAPADLQAILAGMRRVRAIFAQPPIAKQCVGETLPGAHAQSDEEIASVVRKTGTTIYHPVGTCKMGVDPMAVVDPRLRVHGIAGLRVVDASVMPMVTTGNTNAPTVMIAEKAAAMMREDGR
jgi:choline dehydrogenase